MNSIGAATLTLPWMLLQPLAGAGWRKLVTEF